MINIPLNNKSHKVKKRFYGNKTSNIMLIMTKEFKEYDMIETFLNILDECFERLPDEVKTVIDDFDTLLI